MALFYKIAYNGYTVKVVRTFILNKISEEQFFENCIEISVPKFLTKFSKEEKELLEEKIKKIIEINEMKLACFNCYMENNKKIYEVGSKTFDDLKKAYFHGRISYGNEFMGKFMKETNSFKTVNEPMVYKEGELSDFDYDQARKLIWLHDNLCSIKNAKDLINNKDKKVKKKK